MAVKLTMLEELNTSESLKKEDKTTIELGGKSQKYRKFLHSLLFKQLTALFFKEAKWEIAMHYGLDLGKKSTEF